MAVKTSNQHHIGPFQAQTGEGSALRLCMPTQIQLKPVKTVEIEPESAVPKQRADHGLVEVERA